MICRNQQGSIWMCHTGTWLDSVSISKYIFNDWMMIWMFSLTKILTGKNNTQWNVPQAHHLFLTLRRSDSWMIFLEVVAMCLWEAGLESLSLALNILQKYKLPENIESTETHITVAKKIWKHHFYYMPCILKGSHGTYVVRWPVVVIHSHHAIHEIYFYTPLHSMIYRNRLKCCI